jgi:RNA polymerase sigma-70 factor (ECF subfamily)
MGLAVRVSHVRVSDEDLIAAISNGDLQALGALFDRHEPEVRRYVGRLGIRPSDADDVVQATFLEVLSAAPRFDPTRSARSWLMGVATMMARRHRQSVTRALARVATWMSRSIGAEASPPTPAEVFALDETTRRLMRALDAMSPKKREVFALVVLEELSGEEVARALGIPVNTVWTRLHHARLELRAALGGER